MYFSDLGLATVSDVQPTMATCVDADFGGEIDCFGMDQPVV